jgi:hypothetical protein
MNTVDDLENQSNKAEQSDNDENKDVVPRSEVNMGYKRDNCQQIGETNTSGDFDSDFISRQECDTESSPTITIHEKILSLFQWNRNAFIAALRLSIGLTLSSLFVIVPIPATTLGTSYPQGIWVFITVGMTAWQPRMDRATVFKKCWQRILGTFYSALLGMVAGYISLVIEESFGTAAAQRTYMGISVAIYAFVHGYIVDKIGLRSCYVTTLGNFTFGLALFGFLEEDQPWLIGTFRVVNIMIGIIICMLVAVTVFPLSTKGMLEQMVKDHIKITGESVDMILGQVNDMLLNGRCPNGLTEMIVKGKDDDVHTKYIRCVDDWASCRSVIPLLKEDPLSSSCWGCPKKTPDNDPFRSSLRMTLVRCFRIQVNVISIDGICRSDASIQMVHPEALVHAQRNIKIIFDMKQPEVIRSQAVESLLKNDLPQLQESMASAFSQLDDFCQHKHGVSDIESFKNISMRPTKAPFQQSTFYGSSGQSILFLQQLEHLFIRVARLHYFCLDIDATKGGAERKRQQQKSGHEIDA